MNEKKYESILNQYSKSGVPVKDLRRFTSLCTELGITKKNPINENETILKSKVNFVHIAGTNGKGSVSEYIARSLTKSGIKTGKFTSPYILRINERIQIDNEPISCNELFNYAKIVHKAVLKCSEQNHINPNDFSQFEILSAIAFLYFEKNDCGYAVIETGIGGLLDCTNIIAPEISIITAIDSDHSEILGSSISDIAHHKAGIIKKNIPCILYPEQKSEAEQIIKAKADSTNSSLLIPDINNLNITECSLFGNRFIYNNQTYATKMGGRHQIINALTAIEALQSLKINNTCIKQALYDSVLPARMQIINTENNPLIIVDGAHNPHGLKAARILLSHVNLPERKILLIGMMKNKDYISALSEIFSKEAIQFTGIIFCGGFTNGALSGNELYNAALSIGINPVMYGIYDDYSEAFIYSKQLAENGMLLVTGSLYLAGNILKYHQSQTNITNTL